MSVSLRSMFKKIRRYPLFVRIRSVLMNPPVWSLSAITDVDDRLDISGYAFPPRHGYEHAGFTVNGRPFDRVENRTPTGELQKRYHYIEGSEAAGFSCSARLRSEERDDREHLTLQYVDRRTNRPFSERSNFYFPLENPLPMPSAERRLRVHGNDDEGHFIIEGYTTFVKLRAALKEHGGRDYTDFASILDWGCGSGRVGRYFGRIPGIRFTGIDIDGDNVAWCKENLPFGTFEKVPLHPPTGLPAAAYDLIFGISIFTHLKETDQFDWLAELQRLAAPGAMVLMTIHGKVAAARADFSIFRKYVRSSGILDFGNDPILKGYIDDDDYYRSTFHAHNYIRNRWSKYFDIVTIIPGYIGNNQDLVVMRKR